MNHDDGPISMACGGPTEHHEQCNGWVLTPARDIPPDKPGDDPRRVLACGGPTEHHEQCDGWVLTPARDIPPDMPEDDPRQIATPCTCGRCGHPAGVAEFSRTLYARRWSVSS